MKDIAKMFNLVTIGTMILDIILVLMGVFLVANPSMGVPSALVVFGVLLLVSGTYAIIKYIINPRGIFKLELIYGILSIIVGCFSIFKPFDVINLITVLCGIWLLINSVIKLVIALELRKVTDMWVFDLTVAVLTLILALLLIINPFTSVIVFTVYAGIMMIIYSLMDIVEQSFIRARAKDIVKMFK